MRSAAAPPWPKGGIVIRSMVVITIVAGTLRDRRVIRDRKDLRVLPFSPHLGDVAFFCTLQFQKRKDITLKRCGLWDPGRVSQS